MKLGRFYLWNSQPADPVLGQVTLATGSLLRLDDTGTLSGQYLRVCNGGVLGDLSDQDRRPTIRIPDAVPNADGNFLFDPFAGGPRVDQDRGDDERRRARYVEASHFAEVNTYFHIDRMAAYVHDLLKELDAPALPRVIAKVHMHNGCSGSAKCRDGVVRRGELVPFQGGHYRLPSANYDVPELHPIAPQGEIHLGSGRRMLSFGALARSARQPYRHNAGHNAGIIYHEYAHHVIRHTADFRANNLRPSGLQSNRKVAMDEGTCDYLAAAMLKSPHIWAWHRRIDAEHVHRRSLTSPITMLQYDRSPNRDPHRNGTIWSSALWDFRCKVATLIESGERLADKIVLKGLLVVGGIQCSDRGATCRARSNFGTGLSALLQADHEISGDRWREHILRSFAARGIAPRQIAEVSP